MLDYFSRRNFLAGISASAFAAIYPPSFIDFLNKESTTSQPKSIIKPKMLKPGSTLGLIAPATALADSEQIAVAKEIAESFGFKVVIGKNTLKRYGYLAGSDEERAADINEMFRREDIDGIFPLQGGWGSMRTLPYLDFEMIRKNPKVFIGFSDITTLLLAFYKFSGLVVFHGPNVRYSFNKYTSDYYIRSFTKLEPLGKLLQPPLPEGEKVERENRMITIRGGKASGELIGGNLSLLVTTLGTPFEVSFKGKILFIEDVGEEPYRIDRMLTHLELSGALGGVAGVVLGKFRDCVPKAADYIGSLTIEEIFRTKFEKLGAPVISGLCFGHVKDHITLPIGIQATLDADAKTLTIEESAVSQ